MTYYNCILNLNIFVFIFAIFNVLIGALGRDPLLEFKVIDVSISHTQRQENVENIISLKVTLDNGTVTEVNLELTDGVLANDATPVWAAVGKSSLSDNVMYTRDYQVVKDIGKFSFYQNYEYKAAAVLFHDHGIVEGVVGYFPFKKNIIFRKLRNKSPGNISANWRSSSASAKGEPSNQPQSRKNSNTIYPELFIMLDRNYVRNSSRDALQQALVYWNNVDMLYSDIKSPEIKLTIAGIGIPMNDKATPWIYRAQRNNGDYIDAYEALHGLENYFFKHQRKFLNHSYAIVVGLVSTEMRLSNEEKDLIGISFHEMNCEVPRSRAVVATYINNSYRSGAHGLAHLFSALDDEDTKTCKEFGGIMAKNTLIKISTANLLWSRCSRDSFSNYFNQPTSQCLRNTPKIVQNGEVNTTEDLLSNATFSNTSHQINNKDSDLTVNACSIQKNEVLFYSLFVYFWLENFRCF